MAFLPLVAAGVSAAGALFGGISALEQGKYQSQVAKNNAAIATRNAGLASDAAQTEALRSDREFLSQEATQKAIQSASGLDVLGRTQLMTRANTDRLRQEQAKDIRLQGDANVQSLLQDAANFKSEASAAKLQGKTALVSSIFDAGSQGASLLGGARSTKKTPKYKY